MVLWTALLCGLILCSTWGQKHAPQSHLSAVKQWKLLTYKFEPNAPVHDKKFFNPEKIVATGIAVGVSRIFLATPRLFSGVPATVSTVSRDKFGDSPALEAYPNWAFHTKTIHNYNCSEPGLVSAYRVRIDSCNRLWVLDAGVSRSFEDYEITCHPRIFIFDLMTDKIVRRIDIPHHVLKRDTLLTNLVIDESTSKPENNCNDAFVYICDTVEPGIVVYDSVRDAAWRVSHRFMYPNPDFGESRILEDKFILMDGILGLGFDSKAGLLYFHQIATNKLFSVSTKVLRAGPVPDGHELPVKVVGRKSSQGVTLAVSKEDGTIFFSPFSETAVASWNPTTNEQKVLAYDPEALQFVADTSLPSKKQSGIYVLSSRFHNYLLKNVDPNVVNVRILRIDGIGTKPVAQLFFPDASYHHQSGNPPCVRKPFQYEAPGYSREISYVIPSILYSIFSKSPHGINLQHRKRVTVNNKAPSD